MKALFTKTFEPKKISDLVLTKRLKSDIGEAPTKHVLLHGRPGMGKSTVSRIYGNKYVSMKINASIDGRIDALRNDILEFCSTVRLEFEKDTTYKVIQLEELDKASESFFDGLRGFMDEFEDTNVRFVATLNYISKIPDPLKSRFKVINFDPISSDEDAELYELYCTRFKKISSLSQMKLSIQEDLFNIIMRENYPDFRKPLQIFQQLYENGTVNPTKEDLDIATYNFMDLYKIMIDPSTTSEQLHTVLIGEYGMKSLDVLNSIGQDFCTFIIKNHKNHMNIVPNITILIAKYLSMLPRVDNALVMKACLFEINIMLKNNQK